MDDSERRDTMKQLDDAEIITLFFSRDERAIAETSRKFGGLCKSIAHGVLGSREDAEECLSDALFQLWNTIPPEKPRSLCAYLSILVRNLACNRREALSAQKRGGGQIHAAYEEIAECIAAPDTPEDHLDYIELTDALNAFLDTLQPETRTIFVLRYWGALSVKEIAAKCAVSQSKVKMSLLRTRNALKDCLSAQNLI